MLTIDEPQGAPCFIPEVPTCQVVGVGVVPEGHYGIGGQTITQRTSRHLYKTPLSEEEEKEGIVRLVQLVSWRSSGREKKEKELTKSVRLDSAMGIAL